MTVPLTCTSPAPATNPPDDEAVLIERARNQPLAVAQLYREHYAAISRYVLRRVGHAAEAEDVVGDVFLTMVRCLPRYRHRGVPFRAWLYRLASDQVARWCRRRRKQVRRQLIEAQHSATSLPAVDEAECLRLALATLPARFQIVLSLHYLEELSVAEIAQALCCSQGTVKSRLSRGRARLREILLRKEKLS